jgi:chromate reductase
VLKNAIDVGSRPYGESVFDKKPAAIVTASPGGIGGFGANHHLRQSLVFLNVPAMAQPEAYLGHVDKLFDATGQLANDGTQKFLQGFLQAYAAWIVANAKA